MYFDPEYERMKELGKKAWSYFPEDYKKMPDLERQKVKDKVNEEHPELKSIWSEYFTLRGSLERKGLNFRIQGFAGSQTKLAGILLRKHIIEHNLENQVMHTNSVHDEVLVESVQEYSEDARKLVQNCMEEGGNFFCKSVKMTAEAVICDFWKH